MEMSLLPVWLLLAVVMHQRWRMYKYDQSAWKGGGFGMFSDIHTSWVAAVVTARNADGSLVDLRVDSADWMSRFNVIPTARNLQKWATLLLHTRWRRSGDSVLPFQPDRGDPLHVCRVTLRHFRIEFDGRTGVHSARVRSVVSVEAGGTGGGRR
jgi:hypothetical protein